ncbi:MAG: ComEC/Rec2 family competence protein [Patescibacteria group bacterium]
MCDVGQGDSILIHQGFFQMVVDSGPDSRLLKCFERNMPVFDNTIEWVVLTHYDKDHVGGFVNLFNRYHVLHVLLTPYVGEQTEEVKDFFNALGEEIKEGAHIWLPFPNMVIEMPNSHHDLKVEVLWPTVSKEIRHEFYSNNSSETYLSDVISQRPDSQKPKNDVSIVLLLTIDKVKVLLTGDLEAKGEQALIEDGLIGKVDVLKIGHHGSKFSSTPAFLESLQPELFLISVGKGNQYGHPDTELIKKLTNLRKTIFRTDIDGEVTLFTNGTRIWSKH